MNIDICYNSEMEFDRVKFSKFIQTQFFEWRGNSERNWSEFADHIGVTQQTMAAWKNGYLKRIPNQENVNKLVSIYGLEIYDILGIPKLDDPIDLLPEPLRSIAFEVRETVAEYKVAGDSPKVLQIQEEILKKYGYDVISKSE